MSGKNVVMRNAVVVLSVVCAIALISISVIFVYHDSIFQSSSNSQIADLQNQIAQIQSQKTNLESQIADLQNQINSLNSQLAAAGTNNQVQVSGTIQWTEIFRIEFVDARARDYDVYNLPNGTIQTSAPVLTDHSYSVLLIGGLSYEVRLYSSATYRDYAFSLYVPSGVTVFTANF